MLEDRIVYINDKFVPWNEANVHIMSHSFGRGSAIFEVLSVHKTKNGKSVYRLDEHVKRFFRTAGLLKMKIPLSDDQLSKVISETLTQNSVENGFIKVIGYYPQISFTIMPPQEELTISVFVVNPEEDLGGLDMSFEQGTRVCISKWRKLDPQTVPITAKAAANYLNGMLAQMEARERGFNHGIMLDSQGFIAEGGTESIFLVIKNQLFTPARGTVLESITRKSILEIADTIGIEAHEERLLPESLFEADEIFLAGTAVRVYPVGKIEDRIIEQTPGPITRKLAALVEEITSGHNEQFSNWMF